MNTTTYESPTAKILNDAARDVAAENAVKAYEDAIFSGDAAERRAALNRIYVARSRERRMYGETRTPLPPKPEAKPKKALSDDMTPAERAAALDSVYHRRAEERKKYGKAITPLPPKRTVKKTVVAKPKAKAKPKPTKPAPKKDKIEIIHVSRARHSHKDPDREKVYAQRARERRLYGEARTPLPPPSGRRVGRPPKGSTPEPWKPAPFVAPVPPPTGPVPLRDLEPMTMPLDELCERFELSAYRLEIRTGIREERWTQILAGGRPNKKEQKHITHIRECCTVVVRNERHHPGTHSYAHGF